MGPHPDPSQAPRPPDPAPPGRRGPGRLRRWLLRPAVWAVVAVVVVTSAAVGFAGSRWARAWLRDVAEARATDFLDRPVTVGEVEFEIFPPGFSARDVGVAGPAPGDPPVVTAPRLTVDFDVSGFLRPKVELRQIVVERPELSIVLAEDGSTNLPRLGRTGGGPRRAEVTLGSLIVEDGVVRLEEREIPLDFVAEGVQARVDGPDGPVGPGSVFAVQALARRLTVRLPEAEPYTGAVSARATVASGRVDLAFARFTAPEVTAEAGGTVTWGEDRPTAVKVAFHGHGETAIANRLGYLDDPIRGPLTFAGSVDSGAGGWVLSATAEAPLVAFFDRRFANLAARVGGDPAGVTVDLERAAYAGGALTGRVEVPLVGGEPRTVEIAAELAGADLETLLADQGIALADLAGAADLTLDYRATTADLAGGRGEGTFRVRAVAPAADRGAELPVAGGGTFTLAGGRLATDDLVVEAPGQAASAALSVDLASGRTQFDFRLTTDDLGRLAAATPEAADPDLAPWWPGAGRGEISGELEVAAGAVTGPLRLELTGVATPRLALDRLSGGLLLAPQALSELRLEAGRGAGALIVAGTLPLPPAEGEATARRPEREPATALDLRFDLQDWPIAELAPLLPAAVAGRSPGGALSGRLRLGGDWEALAGEADLSAAPFALAGLIADRAEAAFTFDPRRLEVARAAVATPAGAATASGSWDLASGALDLRAAAPALDLAAPPLAAWRPEAITGQIGIELSVGGTAGEPDVALTVDSSGLRLAGRPLVPEGTAGDGARLVARWQGTRLTASASLAGLLEVAGGGRLAPPEADLAFDVSSTRLADLVALAAGGEAVADLAGEFAGRLTVAGRLDGDEPPPAVLTLDRFAAAWGDHPMVALEPVVARLAAGRLEIDSFYLGETGTANELFVGGRIDFAGEEPRLALNLQTQLAADWAEPLLPGFDLSGTFEALATVRGPLARPRVNGQGELTGGKLVGGGLPHSFDEIGATVLFYPDQVVLDSLEATFASGTVRAAGRIGLPTGDLPADYRFQATGIGLALRYPEGFLLRADVDLNLASTADGRQIVGVVELEKAFYLQDVPVNLIQLAQRLLQRQRVEAGDTDEWLAATQLNLSVHGPGALSVRNNVADLTGDVELSIRGTPSNPRIFGQVEIAPGGELLYADNTYTVDRGLVTFANPNRIDPVIDLVATTEVRDYDVTLQLSGTLERLDARFTSDPPLADLDVLALLTTGTTLGAGGRIAAAPGGDPGQSGGGGAQTFLYGQAASALTSRVGTLFGFDRFQVSPVVGAGGDPSSVAFTVGKQLSRDLYVTYSRDPSTSLDYVVQAEWRVDDGVTVILTQNGDRSFAVDVRWEKRF